MTAASPCGHGVEHLRVRKNGTKDCVFCKKERDRRYSWRVIQEPAPIVFATPAVIERAAELGVDRPIENVTREALIAGRFRPAARIGFLVPLTAGVVAHVVRRRPSVESRRESFLITGLRRTAT